MFCLFFRFDVKFFSFFGQEIEAADLVFIEDDRITKVFFYDQKGADSDFWGILRRSEL